MILYIDCSVGVSGDMLLAAFCDMGLPLSLLRRQIDRLPLHVRLRFSRIRHARLSAARLSIRAEPGNGHFPHHMEHILRWIQASSLKDSLKRNLSHLWKKLATVEGEIHHVPWKEVVFHQLAGPDTMVSFLGFCVGLDYFDVRDVRISSVPLGNWHRDHDKGWFPAPGPATRRLLSGFPIERRNDRFEWTTPTGAAILSSFARAIPAPPFSVLRVGCATGALRSPRGESALRLLLGDVQLLLDRRERTL